ncbi:uncharacterized protein [Parasteatoda tepidariorum]|uniref:uncharacterized protein n=1 Tax=Parasteatoda tepidariorum TaxID=114398 RepID=UPI00077F8330|nr:uncharacterized protein LOC107436510 [Parasteatoda tepidariorum]
MEKNNEEKEDFRSWLIAFGAFIISVLVMCPYRLSGLVYVVLIETYETDRKLAAMPIVIFILMTSILGPPAGLLGQKLGSEKITLLGVLLAALGFSGVYFAENITVVIIFLGFIYGAGLATGTFFLPNIIKKYFRKNLNTAIGIVKCGSCVGALIFPPMAIYLLDIYGTAGTFLVVAGIMLNGLPVGLLIMMVGKDVETLHKPPEILLQEKTEIDKPPESKVKNKIKDDISGKDLFATLKETRTDCPLKSTCVFTSKKSTEDHSSDEEQSNKNVLQFEKCNNFKKNSSATSSKNPVQSASVKNTDASITKVDKDNNETQSNDLEQKSNSISYNSDCELSNEIILVSSTNNMSDDLSISSNGTFINNDGRHNNDSEQSKEATLLSSTNSTREDFSISSNGTFTNNDESLNNDCKQSNKATLFSSTNSTRDNLSISSIDTFTNSDVIHNSDYGESNESLYSTSKCSSTDHFKEDFNILSPNVIILTAPETNFNLNSKYMGSSMQTNNSSFKRKNYDNYSGNGKSNEIALPSSGNSAAENSNTAFNVSIKSTSKTKKHAFWSSLKVFMNPIFLVLVTIMSILAYIVTLVWTTLIDYSRDKGLPKKYEVYVLMFPPLFDLVGRIGFLWVVDKGFVGYTMFQMTTSLICAISVLGLILCSSFVMLMTYSSIFALITGAQIAIAPGLIFKFLEKEEQMMAMASRNILYAPLSFTVVPLIGYFRNELKSYDGVYYVIIALSLISFALTPLANLFLIAKKRRKMKALEMDIVA